MAKPISEFILFVCDALAPLGEVSFKRMFGGYGIYCGGLMFALVLDDTLYFKADAESIPIFQAVGSSPFTYVKSSGKTIRMNYWVAPASVFDEPETMQTWGKLALAAALRTNQKTIP